jgi:hypothetical protein
MMYLYITEKQTDRDGNSLLLSSFVISIEYVIN